MLPPPLLCPAGYYADSDSGCANYYWCSSAGDFYFSCGKGTLYNQATGVCDWPSAVSCGNNKAGGAYYPPSPAPAASNGGYGYPSAGSGSSGGSSSKQCSYSVMSGDSLYLIATAHGMSLAALEALNPQIPDFNRIYPGQTVYLCNAT